MEYRDFRYTNEYGQVELERGSLVGVVLSWLAIHTLNFVLLVVFVGIGYSIWKYATLEADKPKVSRAAPQACIDTSPTQPIDYRLHPPPVWATAPPEPSLRHMAAPAKHPGSHRSHHVTPHI